MNKFSYFPHQHAINVYYLLVKRKNDICEDCYDRLRGGASLHSYLHELRQTIMLVMSKLLHISLFHPFNGFDFVFTDTCSNYLYNLQMIDIFLKELKTNIQSSSNICMP